MMSGSWIIRKFIHLPALLGAWWQEFVDLVAILGARRILGHRNECVPGGRTLALSAPSVPLILERI